MNWLRKIACKIGIHDCKSIIVRIFINELTIEPFSNLYEQRKCKRCNIAKIKDYEFKKIIKTKAK